MYRGKNAIFLGIPLLIVAIVYLASCATPPPTQELAAAEAAVADAKAAGCPDCAPEECAAAEAALAKGKAIAGEFCAELEARRMLIDAKAKADEAKFKCQEPPMPPPGPAPDLKDIFFDFNKYNIRPDAAAVLQENAQVLNDNPSITVLIEGYADIRGTPAYNLKLAQNRADSTRAGLVNLGVDASRIQTASGGETEQFAAGTTEDAYQLNRRAHLIVTSPTARVGARIIFQYNN